MIKVDDINLETNTGSMIYVIIDVFRFIKDEELSSVEIQIENQGEYEFLQEIDDLKIPIINHDDLRVFSLNWIFKNIEITNKKKEV